MKMTINIVRIFTLIAGSMLFNINMHAQNLTIDIISSWIDEQNPNIKENLKNQLLDRKIYVTNILPLPWETSQSVETEEPATTEEPPSETP